jgi:hypothetical protein
VTWLKHSSTSRATCSSLMSPRIDQPWDICREGEEHVVSSYRAMMEAQVCMHATAPL